jgi:hypothetical protein
VEGALKMLLYKGVKPEFVSRLRVGGFFENATITEIVKQNTYIRIVTTTGDVYNVHHNPDGCNVFLQRKELREMRRAREKAKRKLNRQGE